MQWSKVKKRFEENVAESLVGRIQVHTTNYSRIGQAIGRGWILLDGVEIFSIRIPSSNDEHWSYPRETMNFGEAVREVCELSIEAARSSEDILVRGLSLLDRRCGKRSLERLSVDSEHEFVQHMFQVRCGADGMRLI